jgi:D-alanyl-D-alanine carboxypeptidase
VAVVTIDGQTVHTIVAAAYGKLEAAFRSATGKDLIITSGFRSNAEQTALFLARYRPQASGNGPYGDVRVYKGVRYVRVSSAGTVAVPGTSRHENYRALDVRDSGADNGVTVAGTVRANWLKANASKYGFNPAGYGFGEPWHIEFNGSLGDTAGTGTPVTFANLPAEYIRALQTQLGVEPDGIFGTGSTKALQSKVGADPDGIFGPDSLKKTQSFIGAEPDGIWGSDTTNKLKLAIDAQLFAPSLQDRIGEQFARALQTQLGVASDGIIGLNSTKALQTKIGTAPDGVFGRDSLTKLQSFVGAEPDGIWGPDTVAKVQAAITANKFGTAVAPPVVVPAPKPPLGIPEGTMYGIDIAWPQTGVFDWNAVKTKYNFAIIKAAGAEDGLYGPADLLDKHLAGARSVGLKVGFYFFNNNRMSIKDQADKFISVLTTRIRPGDFVALDIENVGSQAVAFNPSQALEFAHYVELGMGVKTLMYLNRSHVNGADWSQVVNAGHPLWLATLDGLENGLTYLLPNSVKWWGKASIVQFSSTVPIVGYPHGAVDQDIGFVADMDKVAFVAIPKAPEVPVEPEPEVPDEPDVPETPPPTPVDPDAVPSWFKRFLEGLIGFIKSFLGVTS